MVRALVPQGTSQQHPQLKRPWHSERAEWEARLRRSDPGSRRPSPPAGPSPPGQLLKGPKFSLSAKAVEPAERAGGRALRCRPRKGNTEMPAVLQEEIRLHSVPVKLGDSSGTGTGN